jgi:hypothetical protein
MIPVDTLFYHINNEPTPRSWALLEKPPSPRPFVIFRNKIIFYGDE